MKYCKVIFCCILIFSLVFSMVGCDISQKEVPIELSYGAEATETPLSNAVKLLKAEKKLTIGYIGGSITNGNSATKRLTSSELNKEAKIKNSWVNRTSTYFAEKYPDAVIETVNVGVSNTQTNFAIFRLEKELMNTNGHDMPDLVFIEFCTNDWNSGDELKTEIESLVRNIYRLNPYAEIVVISTASAYKNASRLLYQEICKEYNIPFVCVGLKLRSAIRKKDGVSDEKTPLFYTTDNLHPSAEGYKLYTDLIIEALQPLLDTEIKEYKLYNYYEKMRAPIMEHIIESPKVVYANELTLGGNAGLVETKLTHTMFGTAFSQNTVEVTPNCILLNKGDKITYNFSGATFGVIMKYRPQNFSYRYRIDGGEWVEKKVDSHLGNQTQASIWEHFLSDGEHTVELESLTDDNYIGAFLVNQK